MNKKLRKKAEKVAKKQGIEKKKFEPNRAGAQLCKDYIFKTLIDTEKLFVYDDGVYIPQGEQVIKREMNKRFGNLCKRHYTGDVIFWVKTGTYTRREDAPIHLLCLKNGIYNLKTKKLIPHSPLYFFVTKLPIVYDKNAECPKFKKFLSEVVTASDIPIIQEIFGYCLHRGYPIHKILIFLGTGRNGKSTVLHVLVQMLGEENVSAIALQTLETNRFAEARLFGKLANVYADLPANALKNTGKIKLLTGGDLIEAEQKFGGSFKFNNYAKMVFSTNKIPEVEDDTDAFFARPITINFPNQFLGDDDVKGLKYKLVEEELSGIFNWALQGYSRVMKQGGFSREESIDDVKVNYRRNSSNIAGFVYDCLNISPEEWIEKPVAFGAYREYCKEHGTATKASNTFGADLPRYISADAQQLTVNGSRLNVWKGICFKSNAEAARGARVISRIKGKCKKIYNNNSYIKEDNNPLQPLHPKQPFLKKEWFVFEGEKPTTALEKEFYERYPDKEFDLWLNKMKEKGVLYESKPGRVKVL